MKNLDLCHERRRIWARFCESFMSFWQILRDFIRTPNFKKTLLWGIVLYGIALFALVRGDIYYMDDFQHSISDHSNANTFSRYLMPLILGGVLTLGKGTLDISPLPQILGVVFVVISAMILLYLIRKKFDFIGILASLSLGLSPHFLQNLSYKFDAITMGIALFLAIFPFLFQNQKRLFVAVSVVCLLLMLMTYQAANASYIILSLYFAIFMRADFKANAKFLALCALNLIIASLIYKLAIAQPVSEYIVAYTSDKMLPLDSGFVLGVWGNLATYATTIFNDFKNTPFIYLIALNCVLFVLNAICCESRRIYAFLKAILFLTLGFCASYGLYAVLEMPIFEPRVFYGFNALVAILTIVNIAESNIFCHSTISCHSKHCEESKKNNLVILSEAKNLKNNRVYSLASLPQNDKIFLRQILRYLSIASTIITAYFLISFANIYGNALKKQDEYLDFRARLLLQDLSDKIPHGAMIDLYIYIDKHPVAKRFADKYGAIARLIPKVAENDWFFHWRLAHLNAQYNFHNREMCSFLKENFGGEIVFKNAYHTIERVKSCYVVTINK